MNKKKFLALIVVHKDKLFRLALSILKERETASEVVQEVLMKMWEKRHQLDQSKNIESYVLQSVQNRSINALKKRRKNDQTPKIETLTEPSHPLEGLHFRESRRIIDHIISKLPKEHQMILHLRNVEECSYQEIAGIMKMTVNNVRVIMSRCRKKIHVEYQKIHDHGL